jgi:FdrA protein
MLTRWRAKAPAGGYTSAMTTTGTSPTSPDADADAAPNLLLAAPPRVINIGLELFAGDLLRQGAQVVHVRWTPPAGGNARLASLLSKLRS